MNTWQFHFLNWQGVNFTLDYLSEHSHSHTSLIWLIAWNLPCYLHFTLCLFVWLIKRKFTHQPSRHWNYFWGSYEVLRGWKGGPWSPELLGTPKVEGAWFERGRLTGRPNLQLWFFMPSERFFFSCFSKKQCPQVFSIFSLGCNKFL